MKKLIVLVFLVISQVSFSQQDERTKHLIGTTFENYTFKTLDSTTYEIAKSDKPKVIVVTASWCGPCVFLSPSMNELAEEYSDKVDFITLFWDKKKQVEKIRAKYHKNITLIPSEIRDDKLACIEISGFKNCFGFPSVYFLDTNNIIKSITIGATKPIKDVEIDGQIYNVSAKQARKQNYDRNKREIEKIIE